MTHELLDITVEDQCEHQDVSVCLLMSATAVLSETTREAGVLHRMGPAKPEPQDPEPRSRKQMHAK